MGGIVVRSFAEALRKALQAQILRQPDMEVGAIDIPTDSEPQVRHPNFEHVKLGDGVLVTPLPITAGEEVRIWYGGLLAKSGAVDVYLHMGIGPGAWQQVRDVRMKKESAGIFSCIIQAPAQGGRLEFCFHDGAGNWDNQQGRDWHFPIHNGLIQ
jgi:hypothetical protein